MNESVEFAPIARTWREIPQQVKPRAMSREGRKRFAFSTIKSAAVILLAGVAAWGGYEIVSTWQSEPRKIAAAVNSEPVKEIALLTDGVLDLAWVTRTLALPKKITLMEVDLRQVQARLTESGQVRTAVVTKTFPATLSITLAERSPVARVMAAMDGAQRELVVARDGVVYRGAGYDVTMTKSLPWLDGVKLLRGPAGFQPIPGMETVAQLLTKARNEAPELYSTWDVVNLDRLQSDAEIEVRSSGFKAIFTTQDDFFRQIAKLDYIRDRLISEHLDGAGVRVNLAVGNKVPVAFDQVAGLPPPISTSTAPDLRVAAPRANAARAEFPIFPSPQRPKKNNREF